MMKKQTNPFTQLKDNVYLVPLVQTLPNPYQVRVELDSDYVASLAENIKAHGLQQHPKGRLLPSGKVQFVFGHNRLAAYKLLAKKDPKYKVIPVEIIEANDELMLLYAIAENQHDPLKVRDQIHVADIARKRFKYTSEQIGEKLLNMSGSGVRALLRMKNLPPEILALLDRGQISQPVARRVLSAIQFLGDAELITSRVFSLQNANDASVQEAILEAFKEAGGVQTLNLSDGKTDKMSDSWIPGTFEPREWQQVSSAYPFKHLNRETIVRLLSEDPDPQNAHEELALEMLTHMREPGPCGSCPFSIKLYKVTYCSISACYRMKQDRWAEQTLERLSEKLGIQPYQKKFGSYRDVEAPFYETTKEVEKALKKKSDDLCLVLDTNLSHPHYYTDSHWVKLVWIGERAAKPTAPPQNTLVEKCESKSESKKKDIEKKKEMDLNGLIDYATPILSTWLQDQDDAMTIALALMKIHISNRSSNVYLSISRKILAVVLDQAGAQNEAAEYLADLAAKFDIPLPGDWNQKIAAFGFKKNKKRT
jgi:ParB/RepB/Spo0J family partition protein